MKPNLESTKLRKSSARGYVNQGWLESYHSFSFTGYYNPAYMHFSVLRVINENVIEAGQGFDMHPHKNMEIITYMLQGELRHKNSLGNTSVIRAGDVQCVTSGAGMMLSEINASNTNVVHLLQVWVLPERKLLKPRYETQHFTQAQKNNRWRLIVSHDGRENSLKIHQDISLFATLLTENELLNYILPAHRSLYIQLASGEIEVCGQHLSAGDALMTDGSREFTFKALTQSEILLFDLPIHHSINIM